MVTEFTPLLSLLGGVLIGASAVMLMIGLGRIAGATGIMSGILFPSNAKDFSWRLAMVSGMMMAVPLLAFTVQVQPNVVPDFSLTRVIIGGLIVGVGVTLGGGCTSGHGICGLARLSPRSAVAVVSFMIAAFVTVFINRHVLGL